MTDSTLQVVVDIQSKTQGLEAANAQMAQLRAQTEAATAAGQAHFDVTSALSREEAARTAALTQQTAIESQLAVIAQTRFELAAAAVKGDEAQVELLSADLGIRNATLGVMRAETLTQAELNKLTGQEAALLAIAAKESEAVAAGGILAGASFNKAKGEALVLSREIATGSVNARTLGALLGSLGTTITVAGLVGYGLNRIIVSMSESAVELANEYKKGNEELDKQVGIWIELAKNATDFKDVLNLSEKMDAELQKASAKLAEFRAKEVKGWKSLADSIAAQFSAIPGYGARPNQAALDAQTKAAEDNLRKLLADSNALADSAKLSADEVARIKYEPVAQGIADVTAKIDTLKSKQEELNIARVAGVDATAAEVKEAAKAYDQWVKNNVTLTVFLNLLKELTKTQETQNKEQERTVARDRQREITELVRQQENLLRQIAGEQSVVKQDPYLGVDAARDQLHTLALREQAQILVEIGKIELEIKKLEALGDPEQQVHIEQLNGKLDTLRTRFQLLGFEIKKTTAGGEFTADLANWVNSFGTAAHQITGIIEGSINASLQGTNQLLLDAAFRTGDWRQTIQGVERQILNLFLTWLEQMALQQAASLLGITTTKTAQVASGSAIAAAHAPAAAATSISSYGWAAVIGEVLAIAAIAAIMAALGGAFHEGGIVGASRAGNRRGRRGPISDDEQWILAMEEEGIFTPEQMAHLMPTRTDVFSSDQLGALATGRAAGGVVVETPTMPFPIGGIDLPPESPPAPTTAPFPGSGGWPTVEFPRDPRTVAIGGGIVFDPSTGHYYDPAGIDLGRTRPGFVNYTGAVPPGSMPSSMSPAVSDFYAANQTYGVGGWYYNSSGDPVPNSTTTSPTSSQYSSPIGPGLPGMPGSVVAPWGESKLQALLGMGPAGMLTVVSPGASMSFADANPNASAKQLSNPAFYGVGSASQAGTAGWFTHPVMAFHSGGLGDDEMLAKLLKREFVMQTRAVDHYGVDAMEHINNLRIPISRIKLHDGGMADGSFGGGGSSTPSFENKVHIFPFIDRDALIQAVINSPENKKFVVDVLRGTVHEFGINAV